MWTEREKKRSSIHVKKVARKFAHGKKLLVLKQPF